MRWLFFLALALGACTKSPPEETQTTEDRDGDGYDAEVDCDDADGNVHPDAVETCNDIDDDCDLSVDEDVGSTFYTDGDGDGYGDDGATVTACEIGAGLSSIGGDCDDGDAAVSPVGTESCNDVDDDCDGATDEDVAQLFYGDTDGDGYGDPENAVTGCDATGFVENASDCDDTDPDVNPDGQEICNDIDDDCNDLVDDDPISGGGTWYGDGDGDGWGDPLAKVTACEQPTGTVTNGDDCDDTTVEAQPGGTEVCDGYDNDCNGVTDDEFALDATVWYYDADGDTYGTDTRKVTACDPPSTAYVERGGDCDDADAATNPGVTWYADADGDGYGNASTGLASCLKPTGYVSNDDDCADGDAARNPLAAETCDLEDDDCDGTVDDSPTDAPTWYRDADADGYGAVAVTTVACSQPTGYVSNATDCLDSDDTAYPGASEYCDSVDDDCDGTTDESAVDATTWYRDADGDGYGTTSPTTTACTKPTGYAATSSDCNDASTTYSPATVWYYDVDGDLYGDASATKTQCASPGAKWVLVSGDCRTSDAASYPGAAETCFTSGYYEGYDNDCDGSVDEGCAELHCGTISADEVWEDTPEGHYVGCSVYVEGSTVPLLTIEDGAHVEFNTGTYLYVGQYNYGDVAIEGTSAGVTFTSASSSPAAGDWGGVQFGQYSSGSVIEGLTLEYTQYYGISAYNSYFEIYDSTIRDSLQYGLSLQGTDAVIDGVTVEDNGTYGIYLYDSSVEITNSTIQRNGNYGLYCSSADCLAASFAYNVVTDNLYPLYLPIASLPLLATSSTYKGNTNDYIEVSYGTITANTTWNGIDVPYRISSGLQVDGPATPVLTLSDGVQIQMGRYSSFYVGCCTYSKGDLVVNGTTKGVKITSAETSPTPGSYSFNLNNVTSATKITGLTVEYAYYGLQISTDASLTVTNYTSRYNQYYGLYVSGASSARTNDLTITNSTISDSSGDYAAYFYGDVLTVDNVDFDGGTSAALYSDAKTNSIQNSSMTGATRSDGNAYGAYVTGTLTTWKANSVTDNDRPLYLQDADAIFALDAASKYSGNTLDYVYVSDSSLGTSGTIPAIDASYWFPYGLQIYKTGTTNPVIYATNVDFIFGHQDAPYYQLYIANAEFYATGCTFQGYGLEAGSWYGVYFDSTTKGYITSSDIAYGGYSSTYNLYLGTKSVTATYNNVYDSAGYGVQCNGGCTASGYTLTGNAYSGNALGNIY